jgi:lipid-binding SYLF domain-containing protein
MADHCSSSKIIIKEEDMKRRGLGITILFVAVLCASIPFTVKAESVQEKREDIMRLAENTLDQLYQMAPGARQVVRDAAGYGVFSDTGLKIFTFGSGLGKGVVINNATKKATYMHMGEVQVGLGFGISKFRQVFVFQTVDALNNFINYGITVGAQATGAVQAEGQGGSISGAISVAPGVWIYQITEAGLAAELGITGAKYFKDNDLN